MSNKPTPIYFKAGHQIFKEGEIADAVYLVNEGEVEITKKTSGQEVPITRVTKNGIFGEMAFLDKGPRSATATATTDTRCFKVSAEDFDKKLTQLDPFMKAMFRLMSSHIRSTNERLKKQGN